MYANVRGLKGKKTCIKEILQQHEPHIFLITETQLRSNIVESFSGYSFFHKKREGKLGGGVGILVKNDFRHNIAPHISDRSIEIMWLSIFRKNDIPLIVGVYYGKQESRTSREEIEREMVLLTEEITEMGSDGEILLAMDGNARIGLLGEPVSRNGKCLMQVFENMDLHLLNNSDKCTGKVTRINTKDNTEFSAIDFVVVSDGAKPWVQSMLIDEDGLMKVKGRNHSDHNTIVIEMTITGTYYPKTEKKTCWNIRAPEIKWNAFTEEINKRYSTARNIISNQAVDIDTRYKKWFQEIENAARKTIGKTTIKEGKKEKSSTTIKQFNDQKKQLKQQIQAEQNPETKTQLINNYKDIQERTKEQMIFEKSEEIKERFEKITSEPSRHTFWKEKKKVSRNPASDCIIIKDKNGGRHFEPNSIKENIANYYEELYKYKEYQYHPYHDEVKTKTDAYLTNQQYESEYYNAKPSYQELKRIIEEKKNGKSTTDIRNEMLKRPGDSMVDFIQPLITAIWNCEDIPQVWNKGLITSLYKGKGDKEILDNYRPITTSSAIGTIIEAALDRRIESVVPVTQAQGGGQRKASTFDHLFLLRSIIDLSKKNKTPTFLTFYDVSKAYDHANNDDMLSIVWERGLRGKTWRILRNFCKDLHASVKTRFGLTRDFKMEIGGRQGSRLTGRLFSKMMDVLAEELQPSGMGFHLSETLQIVVLLWVDDVLSFAIGEEEQCDILKKVDEFAKKHRLQWGHAKCNVMRVGTHSNRSINNWKLGQMQIEESTSYKYLGDHISNDGKNTKNIEARRIKTQATTININSIASTEILRKIETSVLLELHDKVTIPGLLANAESWSLLKSEISEFEKVEYQALRNTFDLPLHTPIPALLFTFGTLYTHLRIETRRLNYLHRILNRPSSHWTTQAFHILDEQNIGWAKTIKQTLRSLDLPSDLTTIKNKRPNEWKKEVKEKIEKKNKDRLLEECHKMADGRKIRKTKTAHIVDSLSADTYTRMPIPELQHLTKQETKTVIIARYKMLDCGVNFKNSKSVICPTCKKTDDEDHRLNYCRRYRETNYCDYEEKVTFDDVYSTDINVLKKIIEKIEKVWNTRNAHGTILQ